MNINDKLSKLVKSLEVALEAAKELTTKKRNKMEDETFAFPKQRKMPLNDANHVKNAAARFGMVVDVSESEKRAAYRKILAAGKKFGVNLFGFRLKWGKKYG